MKKGTRRILFWLAVLVFGAASWVVVLLAQGYKYDFAKRVFVRTGAVAVTANTDATLYVAGKEADPMSFLTHRTGVNRLLPGTYALRVVKDGYSEWHKTATVGEGLLTDFPSVLLVSTDRTASSSVREDITAALKGATPVTKKTKPVTFGTFALPKEALGYMLTDDASRVLWWTQTEVWVLWLTGTDYQPFRSEGDKEPVVRFTSPVARAAWFADRDHIVIDLGGQQYRIVETDTRGGLNIIKI